MHIPAARSTPRYTYRMPRNSLYSRQLGLTLAEIGMALFVIGIGALSIATVYLQRERAASINEQQLLAQSLATDMTSRIGTHPSPEIRFENAIGVRCTQTLNNGTAQAVATNDVACWQERVAAQLPNGSGSITLDTSVVPATYAVTVSWSQPRGGIVSYTVRTLASTTSAINAQRAAK
jgi:Tfp pilus assembly protein PilV